LVWSWNGPFAEQNTRGTMHGIGSDYCWHRLKLSSLFDCIFSNV
jgi:hypothetical protein